jgi:hypothetical protein
MIPDSYGRVAFLYAAEGGNVETFKLLAKQTGPNAAPKAGLLQDQFGASPLEQTGQRILQKSDLGFPAAGALQKLLRRSAVACSLRLPQILDYLACES